MKKIALMFVACSGLLAGSHVVAQQAQPLSQKMADCIAREQARNGSSRGMAATTCTEQFEARGEPQSDTSAPNIARGSSSGNASPGTAGGAATTTGGAVSGTAAGASTAAPGPGAANAATPAQTQTSSPSPATATPAQTQTSSPPPALPPTSANGAGNQAVPAGNGGTAPGAAGASSSGGTSGAGAAGGAAGAGGSGAAGGGSGR